MNTTKTTDVEIPAADIQAAADAVTEYLTVAFQPEFLKWDKLVNLAIAEMVWNAHTDEQRGGVPRVHVDASLRELHDRLRDVRRTRWPDADWSVMRTGALVEREHVVFTFDLWWDDAGYCQPCEMTWVQRVAGPVDMN